jgi:hypothetical protein
MKIRVEDLKTGDVFGDENGGWVALSDAWTVEDPGVKEVRADVQFVPDRGIETRVWDAGREIEVTRP